MKILTMLLTLVIGLAAGLGLGVAITALASQGSERSLYTQETVSTDEQQVTVLTDLRRRTVCYIASTRYSARTTVSISCVK